MDGWGYSMSNEGLEVSVGFAIGTTQNGSACGPNSINSRLIKPDWDTRLGRKLFEAVEDNPHSRVIPAQWRG